MTKQELLDTVSEFVDLGIDGVTDGYDNVEHLDMMTLYKIFNAIIEQRFNRTVNGDLPINYQLVDRNKGVFIIDNNVMSYGASTKKLEKLTRACTDVAIQASSTAQNLYRD